MTVRRIDHVQLAMPAGQEEAARAFYQGLLGLNEVEKPSHLAARGGCWFEADGVKVHLGVDPDFRPAKKAHPGFVVDDLSDVCATLEAAGFRAVSDQPLDGYVRKYVNDPFGNRIELMQVLAD
ncbi:VOC family protein [Rhizobium sp. ARZ01]|uniref:VOC family protein n=1 Tax=Rhizobium sp. ARZ01 TaxID=2769313 RepID=UPI0017806833|nr:VOC family protein [Rhizobium sp. ARZ01]MBD9371747.1 VOC family protein [Rhizobium sp. ARZ01]